MNFSGSKDGPYLGHLLHFSTASSSPVASPALGPPKNAQSPENSDLLLLSPLSKPHQWRPQVEPQGDKTLPYRKAWEVCLMLSSSELPHGCTLVTACQSEICPVQPKDTALCYPCLALLLPLSSFSHTALGLCGLQAHVEESPLLPVSPKFLLSTPTLSSENLMPYLIPERMRTLLMNRSARASQPNG